MKTFWTYYKDVEKSEEKKYKKEERQDRKDEKKEAKLAVKEAKKRIREEKKDQFKEKHKDGLTFFKSMKNTLSSEQRYLKKMKKLEKEEEKANEKLMHLRDVQTNIEQKAFFEKENLSKSSSPATSYVRPTGGGHTETDPSFNRNGFCLDAF